jgi:hypothetical protein
MNNLKRVLSLALSGIMLVGMMAVGASAADFSDADKIEHDDAVNVLVALSVINGKDDGSFDPEGDVTRAEMAKMIAVAMNGGKDTNTGVKGTPSFTDIKGHWAESYIEYCYDLNIISGRGDGTFDPGANVTGLEATKMVLTALGYDATAYRLTGASWAVRTDELAKAADPNLYDELGDVVMANNASRDTAAQLIWNGLQNTTRRVIPSTNTSTGETTWSYQNSTTTMLEERYSATVLVGTYVGNYDTNAGGEEGEIAISTTGANNSTVTYNFPSDLGIENIGEEIKVIYRDGNNGVKGAPDKRDTIYGVFNTGAVTVYNVTMDELQSNSDADRIRFGSVNYNANNNITVVYNYDSTTETTMTPTQIKATTGTGLRKQSTDTIKFVTDNDGKIAAAYVVNYNVGQVTAVTSSRVTISGVGAIDRDDNDIYDGVAKDDVVVYTKFYDAATADAFFTVTKAEEVEGELRGFKDDGSNLENVVVDGTTYKVSGKPAVGVGFPSLTSDAITTVSSTNIGDTVKLYMVGGMVAAMDQVETGATNFALVIDVSTGGTLGSSLDPKRVTLLLSDGTEVTRVLHKDSESAAAVAGNPGTPAVAYQNPAVGNLVKYTGLNESTVKVTEAKTAAAAITGTASGAAKVWNSTTKQFVYTGNTAAVAAADAPLFVARDTDTGDGTIDAKDSFNAYTLRNLGDINNDASGVKVLAFTNTDGLVTAAYAVLSARPTSDSTTTLYGIVTDYIGTRTNADNDTLYRYTVAVGRDEDLEVNVSANNVIAKGDIVEFDERANGEYASGDFTKLVSADDTTATGWTLAAIRSYDANTRLLTYYSATSRANATAAFTGTAGSDTLKSDASAYYVNAKDSEQGDEVGISSPFDPNKGYANALLHKNSDGIVDVVIIETSGEANLAKYASNKDAATSNFGAVSTLTLTNSNATIAASAGNNGAYTVALSTTTPEVGAPFTVTVTCSSVDAANANGETVTVTYNSVDYTHTFTAAGTHQFTITAVSGQTAVTAAVAAAQ